MRIAILGVGGIGLAYAAYLHNNGHTPVLWSPTGRTTEELKAGPIEATGAVEATFTPVVADTLAEAVTGADAIVLALLGSGHRSVLDQLIPHVVSGQTIIISAMLSCGAQYIYDALKARGVDATTIGWMTTAMMGRRQTARTVTLGGVRSLLEMAVLPATCGEEGHKLCTEAFGNRFRLAPNLLTVALSNLNPPAHLSQALTNFTRIERGEYWASYDVITPSVARLMEKLDEERLAVAAKCGLTVRSIGEHYQLSFGFGPGIPLAEMAAAQHKRRNGPPGPTTLNTRFVLEDVPFGIVQIIALARALGVDVPVHQAGLVMMSTLYGRDFEKENDLLPDVDLSRVIADATRD